MLAYCLVLVTKDSTVIEGLKEYFLLVSALSSLLPEQRLMERQLLLLFVDITALVG